MLAVDLPSGTAYQGVVQVVLLGRLHELASRFAFERRDAALPNGLRSIAEALEECVDVELGHLSSSDLETITVAWT